MFVSICWSRNETLDRGAGAGDPGFECVLVDVGSRALLLLWMLLWIVVEWWRAQIGRGSDQADNSPGLADVGTLILKDEGESGP